MNIPFHSDKAKEITQDDVDELLDNFYNLDLWKEKIPPNSFIAKGFVISNMFDVTAEYSISEIKSTLIGGNKRGSEVFMDNFQDTFRSLFEFLRLFLLSSFLNQLLWRWFWRWQRWGCRSSLRVRLSTRGR